LLSKDAFFGYLLLAVCSLVVVFGDWRIGFVLFCVTGIGYVFWLQYRCCRSTTEQTDFNAANRRQDNRQNVVGHRIGSSDNSARKTGVMGVSDLPQPRRSGG
jgi:threonine/homoserine/homoserine lactone efflux protein